MLHGLLVEAVREVEDEGAFISKLDQRDMARSFRHSQLFYDVTDELFRQVPVVRIVFVNTSAGVDDENDVGDAAGTVLTACKGACVGT